MTKPSAPAAVLVCPETGEAMWKDDADGGGPTEYGIEVYMFGDCWALAWHVSRLTGCPIFASGWPFWLHVAVETSPGVYLDATGLHQRTTLETAWANPLVALDPTHTQDLDAYHTALDADFVYPSGHGEAEAFARLLISKHLPVPAYTSTTPEGAQSS